MRGIDPRTSGMQGERSTICATSPLRKRGAYDIWSLYFVIALVERSLLLHIVLKSPLSMRVINPCVSHMPIVCHYGWHASLVGSKGAVYVREMSLIHLPVEYCFLRRFSEVYLGVSGAPIAFSACSVLFQMLPFAYWTYKPMFPFGLTKQLPVFRILISRLLWKIGDAGHQSPYFSHAKRALYHLSYIPVEETGS